MSSHPLSQTGHGTSRRSLIRGVLAAAGGAAVTGPLLTSMPASAAPVHSSAGGARPTPASPKPSDPSYLGYRRADYARPYAKYFTETTSPVQNPIVEALAAGMTPAADVPSAGDMRTELSAARGYSKVETGFSVLPDGTLWTAVLTRMPGVTPQMWDWWFGWHSKESARYKLWHPDAHIYAGLQNDLADEPGLTDKQRYIGNTSFVDEYIPDYRGGVQYLGDQAGGFVIQPGISFMDPVAEGFDVSGFNGTAIVGRGGPQGAANTVGIFCHLVRATKDGCEMRSRFYQPAEPRPDTRDPNPAAATAATKRGPMPSPTAPKAASGLMLHCGQEMNHLSTFLPHLYREFRRR